MVHGFRKCVAVLSVLLVMATLRCMTTCMAGDMVTSAHSNAPELPPCHQHHAPAPGSPAHDSVPCQNHPGLFAYFVHPPSWHMDVNLNLLPAVYQPTLVPRESWELAVASSAHIPPLPNPGGLSSIVLRI